MAPGSFTFERFALDPQDRQLRRDDAPVELNARYLDALVLLVREQGKLVSKDRFLEEVWKGVPVTDEALTQCVRTLRRQLGDDAARPRFIETVPKHGYRFIAPVTWADHEPGQPESGSAAARPPADVLPAGPWRRFFLTGGSGMIGGGAAGVFGGLFYGFAGASDMGAASMVLVFVVITAALGLIGGGAVSFGIAAADFRGRSWWWSVLGGAVGGMIIGALVKLIGVDAFNLLFGRSPGRMTGAFEGALLGAAIGFGVWLGSRGGGPRPLRRGVLAAGLATGAAGLVIVLLGGRLLGGSLEELARRFPESRLRLDQVGALFGETGFGPISQVVTASLEGLLFGAWVAGAVILARQSLDQKRPA